VQGQDGKTDQRESEKGGRRDARSTIEQDGQVVGKLAVVDIAPSEPLDKVGFDLLQVDQCEGNW